MTNYQTFESKETKNENSQIFQSPEQSTNSLSNNNLDNDVNIQRDRSTSITSLEEVIINDPGYNGSVMSSVLTLCNTIFGSGMLTIPYAISVIGLVNGIIAVILFGCTSCFTLYLLTQCAKVVGGRNVSFFSISSCTYPKLSIVFDLAVAIKCFGVSISYLVIIGDLLPKVTIGLFPNTPKDSVCLTNLFWITVSMLIVIPLSFQKSLSSLRYASTVSLISVSYIAILVAYFFFSGYRPIKNVDSDLDTTVPLIFSSNSTDSKTPLLQDIAYFKWSLDFFRVLPIFVFAYTCHQNILTVFNEMRISSRRRDNRHKKAILSTAISVTIAISVYLTIGITGYLTFGSNTKSNIISMYPASNILVLIAQLLMAIMVSTCFALQCHPARKSFGNVINYLRTMKKRSGYEPLLDTEESSSRNNEVDDERKPLLFKTRSQPLLTTTPLFTNKDSQDPLNFASSSVSTTETSISNIFMRDQKIELTKSFNDLEDIIKESKKYQYQYNSITIPIPPTTVNTNSIETQYFELSNTLHNCITSVILILAYTIACSVKDLGTVLSVVGATGSTTICYILPGLLYYKIKKNERGDQKSTLLMKISLVTSIAGILLMINSLFFIFAKI